MWRFVDTLVRWFSSPMLRDYEIRLFPRFWRVTQRIKKARFRFQRATFEASGLIKSSTDKAGILRQLINAIGWKIIGAIGVGALAISIERSLDILPQTFDKSAALSFFGTLAQVSAALLTLYFTAISIVAGTYARVPGDIRSRLVQEEVGSFYFGALAQFAAVAVIFLTTTAYDIPTGPLSVLIASTMCLFAVFSFVVLGIRAFHFFDPAALVDHLNAHLIRSIQSVTPTAQKWAEQSFQAFHQKRAEELLGSYANLISIASQKENLHSKALVKIAEGLFSVIQVYASVKTQIPSESFWFKRRNSHKDWLLTPYHEVNIALVTGTMIQPKAVADLNWLEAKIFPLIAEIFSQLGERKELTAAQSITESFRRTVQSIGFAGAIEEGVNALQSLSPKICAIAGINQQFRVDENFAMDRLGIVELYNCSFINLVLGCSNYAKELSPTALETLLSQIEWPRKQSVYELRRIPRTLRVELEMLQTFVDFEIRVEQRLISPSWLLLEMAARGATRFIDDASEKLMSEFERGFSAEIDRQLSLNNYAIVAQFTQRGLEAAEKLRMCLSELKSLHDAYVGLNRSKEYEWPDIKWEGFHERLIACRRKIILGIAVSVDHLASLPEDRWPDFFGHGYVLLGEECMRAMLAGDVELFKQVFPPFFISALRARDRLHRKIEGSNLQRLGTINAPLLDAMEISGYAIVLGEIHAKDCASTVKACWDAYFATFADKDRRTKMIEMLILLTGHELRFAGRSVERTEWQQRVEGCLRGRGLMPDKYERWGREFIISHGSPVVRAFIRGRGLDMNGYDVFFSLYLLKRTETPSVAPPYTTENFKRALEVEQQQHTQNEEGEDEEQE